MARPQKCGVDYFPLDVVMDDSVRLLEAEFGLTGFGILIKLYQRIYRDQGYYCAWNEEVALLFASDCKVGCNVVSEVLSALFKRGILDRSIYEKHGVLTSAGIQRRYLEMVKRRQDVRLDPRYALLLPVSNGVYVDNNGVNVNNNAENVNGGTQSKENKTKGNYSTARGARREERGESSFEVDDFYKAALARSYGETGGGTK